MSDPELCNWNYSRHSYCIIMHELDRTVAYLSPGTGAAPTSARVKETILKGQEVEVNPFPDNLFLEDDDSVQSMVQKTSLITMYRPEYLYFWANRTNMRFDLIYNLDAQTSRRFKYNPEPSPEFTESLQSEADWQEGQRVVTHSFENSFLSSFEYPDNALRVIHCMPMNAFIASLNARDANAIKFNVKTYYPDVRIGAPIIANILAEQAGSDRLVKYNRSDVNFERFQSTLMARNNAVRAINSPDLNRAQQEADDVQFYNCNVLEAVVHMNYQENNESFVDLEKVFNMFPVTTDVPFSRLKTEKDTKYMVHKGATEEKNPDYIHKRILQDWIDPKLSRIMDITDIHAVAALNYSRNVGRGLSFKIFNYGNTPEDKKYMTLNIYKDGKLELKCFWDEQFGEDDLNPGGNKRLLLQAIEKVRIFIRELNNLNYAVAGSKKLKITVPDADPFNSMGRTRIAFFNTVAVFNFGQELNYPELTKYLENYRTYVHLVTRLLPNNSIDTRSLEMRYRRLHNYVQLKNIQRFIKNYKTEHTQSDPETKADLRNMVAVTFSLTKDDAETVIADYEATFENKKRRSRKIVSRNDISVILNRDVSTQSGIDIKIIKRQPKNMLDHTYKCLILGISYEMLGPIHNFLRNVIYYFKHNARLAALPMQPNFLANMLTVTDQTEDTAIKQGNSEVIAEVKTAIERKPLLEPVALGKRDQEEEEMELELDEELQLTDADLSVEQEPLTPDEPAPGPGPMEIEKSVKSHAVTTMVSSFLDLLQTRVKEAYSDSIKMSEPTPYSTKCQKSEGRQPLVIPLELADALKQHVQNKIRELESAPKTDANLNELYEYKIHSKTLERGLAYKPQNATTTYFYFCPLSWNMAVNTPDTVDQAFPGYDMNPQTKDAAKNKYLYMSPKRKFKAGFKGSYTNWKELIASDPDLEGEPPHASYVRFIQTTADYTACRACCFVNSKDTPETAKCLGKASVPASTSSTSSISYIKSEGKFVEANRFAFIPEKLNRIFNVDDAGLKLLSSSNTTISTGFDYYLRKGTKDGKFLNAIGELVPKIKDLVAYISDLLHDDPEIFRSLKKGAINQLFAPEQLSDDLQSDTLISLENFISFLETGSNDINEDFLWDLLSRPDVILPTPEGTGIDGGLNIIVCEVSISDKRSSEVDSGIIRCPVGFEIDELFKPERPSIILYRYKDNYEIICHVEERNKDIMSNALFEPGHPLITDIINHLKSSCHTFPNVKAEQELRKHMESRSSVINRTLISRAELPDIHEAIEMLRNASVARYIGSAPEMIQIVDAHNKVTHLKLTDQHWLPIKPSGIVQDLPISSSPDENVPDLVSMVRLCEELTTFENFDGYRPYAFLMDPGEDLDDPEDDVIIGIMLSNGLICYTQPVNVRDFEESATVLVVSHPDKTLNLEEHMFDMRQLLFSDSEMWYSDYREAEKALSEVDRHTVDMRRIYAVRSSFENETYQRIRYELSRLLQEVYPAEADRLLEIISQIPPGSVKDDIRKTISGILTEILKDHVVQISDLTEDQIELIMDSVGPLDLGAEEITEDDGLSYSYTTPNIRYECFNRALDQYRGPQDIHCMNGKLFVNPINLVTGKERNLENSIARITEEVLRIPIKRQEILEGQMNNFISGIVSMPANAYLLGSENMVEDFKKMYTTAVNYREKMNSHYDNINPQNYKEFEDKTSLEEQRCSGKFVNMPGYWIGKLRSMSWKIYDMKGGPSCIYSELDSIISEATGLAVNTRARLASIIGSDRFTGYGNRSGWELALDYYTHLWRAVYKTVKTKEEMLETIRNSTRHQLSILDLSLISREYGVKFVILAKPNRINKTGIVCLNTTQTHGDDIILLYLQGLTDFSIIKNVGFSPERAVFKLSELPQDLVREWVATCANDHLEIVEDANKLYQAAPVAAKSSTGHTVFVDNTGKVLPNPLVKQVTLKPKIVLKRPTKQVPEPEPPTPEPVPEPEPPTPEPEPVLEPEPPTPESEPVPEPEPPTPEPEPVEAETEDEPEPAPPKQTIRLKTAKPIDIPSTAPEESEKQKTNIPRTIQIKLRPTATSRK